MIVRYFSLHSFFRTLKAFWRNREPSDNLIAFLFLADAR